MAAREARPRLAKPRKRAHSKVRCGPGGRPARGSARARGLVRAPVRYLRFLTARGCGGIGRRARFRSVSRKLGGGSSPLIRITSPYTTAKGTRRRYVARRSDGTSTSKRGFTSPRAASEARRRLIEHGVSAQTIATATGAKPSTVRGRLSGRSEPTGARAERLIEPGSDTAAGPGDQP